MCGRYFTRQQKQEIAERYRISLENVTTAPYPPNYNIAPSDEALFIRNNPKIGELELVTMCWSQERYVTTYRTFNARGDRLLTSPLWSKMMAQKRCMIAMSGFYEYPGQDALAFEAAGADLVVAGGLWSTVGAGHRRDEGTGCDLKSFE